jgi:hypothetical protein
MADETTTAAPTQEQAAPDVQVSTGKTTEKMLTQAEVDKIVEARLARDRKKWETEYQAKLEEERKKAAMSETEKLKAAKDEAEKRAQDAMRTANERLLKAEVKAAAVALDIVDPEAAYVLLDKEVVKVAEDGTVVGVEDALKALVKDKPYLVRQKGAQPVGSGTSPAQHGNTAGKVYTKAEIKAMSLDEINKHWQEISEQMSKGLIK